MEPVQKSVTSMDGTMIAYEQCGNGPSLISSHHHWPTDRTPSVWPRFWRRSSP
jgi:hypothetical protein